METFFYAPYLSAQKTRTPEGAKMKFFLQNQRDGEDHNKGAPVTAPPQKEQQCSKRKALWGRPDSILLTSEIHTFLFSQLATSRRAGIRNNGRHCEPVKRRSEHSGTPPLCMHRARIRTMDKSSAYALLLPEPQVPILKVGFYYGCFLLNFVFRYFFLGFYSLYSFLRTFALALWNKIRWENRKGMFLNDG